ncbi:MAG: hypothetical protein ACK5PS_01890 [Desulfopila sp.]
MEVRLADAEEAQKVLTEDYLRATGLADHDLSTAAAVFDESAARVICPACGTAFEPEDQRDCPECGLQFGSS